MINGVATYYPNQYYEVKEGTETTVVKYYYGPSGKIAMRENGMLNWLLTDNLGSTSVTADANGLLKSVIKYSAFGEIRSANGVATTDYLYTGQRNESEIGLDWYTSRFYDPALGRFIQPDSIIPDPASSKGYDRYAYVNNNPVNFNDPSGHKACDGWGKNEECIADEDWSKSNKYAKEHSDAIFSEIPLGNPVSVGWYGGTNFAYQDHLAYINGNPNYNYDGYCQGYHCGIDLGGLWGDSIYAGISGRVVLISSYGGNQVHVMTPDGYLIIYQHLSSINVSMGDEINSSTLIGAVGNPSNNESMGNYHLHLEVRKGNHATNPLNLFSKDMIDFLYDLSTQPDKISSSNTFRFPSGSDAFLHQPDILLGGPVLWP